MPSYNSDNQTTASAFSYDGNGNPTTYNGNSLSFDAENRMTGFGSVLTAGYTGDGLRGWKTNSTGTTYFLYLGSLPIVELNASGTVTAVNTFGANGLVSRILGSTSTFYTFDPQGNPTQRLDASAAILTTADFDAFGNRTITGSTTDPFSGYASQNGYYNDSETGLELLTHRYYDPQAERFVTRDSVLSPDLNLYGYTLNSPINNSDPLGEAPSNGTIITVICILTGMCNFGSSPGRQPDPVNDPQPVQGPPSLSPPGAPPGWNGPGSPPVKFPSPPGSPSPPPSSGSPPGEGGPIGEPVGGGGAIGTATGIGLGPVIVGVGIGLCLLLCFAPPAGGPGMPYHRPRPPRPC